MRPQLDGCRTTSLDNQGMGTYEKETFPCSGQPELARLAPIQRAPAVKPRGADHLFPKVQSSSKTSGKAT